MPVEPDRTQLEEMQALAGSPGDGPLVMLNLNRYRDREAYLRYGAVATEVLESVGGRILWHTDAAGTVIGDESDVYDEVIAVWYPNAAAFVELALHPKVLGALSHRTEGLERAALIRCEAGAEPALTGL